MSIVCSTLMCHAPIVIPRIAEARASACHETTRAMREAARALVSHAPDVILLVSPHTPRDRTRFGLSHDEVLRGSFARFGHAELALRLPGAPEVAKELARVARARGLETRAMHVDELDHGALVPLYFLHEAGYRGRILLIALPLPDAGSELAFGAAIRATASACNERWALLASGDMSHRLTHDAPSGYDARGGEFDAAFVTALRRGDLHAAITLPRELVESAAEDVVQSSAVALGALAAAAGRARVLSYEGPFGVGYCVALLHAESEANAAPPELAELAFTAIARELGHDDDVRQLGREEPRELAPPWDVARAVFVTLRSPDGELRGCIGRTSPLTDTLAAEVADCAVAAATRDPRVPSVQAEELETLRVEVSVLHPPEPIESKHELDPQRYGVVVSYGPLRGVLLPAIEGVETVDQQLGVVLRKARIPCDVPYRIERFAVDKVVRGD